MRRHEAPTRPTSGIQRRKRAWPKLGEVGDFVEELGFICGLCGSVGVW
jgi:hypothetical protein